LILSHELDAFGYHGNVFRLRLLFDLDDFLASVLGKKDTYGCTSAAFAWHSSKGYQTCVRIDIDASVGGIVLDLVVRVVIIHVGII
jgi:hypothetical protein